MEGTYVETGGSVGSCRARTTSCRLTLVAWKGLQRHLWSDGTSSNACHTWTSHHHQLQLIQTLAKIFFIDVDKDVSALSNVHTWVRSPDPTLKKLRPRKAIKERNLKTYLHWYQIGQNGYRLPFYSLVTQTRNKFGHGNKKKRLVCPMRGKLILAIACWCLAWPTYL